MKRIQSLLCTLFVLFTACNPSIASEEDDFLERANEFYRAAVLGKCRELEKMVRYPVLMDGRGTNSYLELEQRCRALALSADVLAKNVAIDKKDLAFKYYKSGWLKSEVLAGHPLLKIHTDPKSEVSLFLLEVTSNQDVEENMPVTFIFRHDYSDQNSDWDIIMFEDYSLSDLLNRN